MVANSGDTETPPPNMESAVLADSPALTRSAIEGLVQEEHKRALALFSEWAHPFTGIAFTRSRRCFGHADVKGQIRVSESFLGTHAVEDLRDTIRHEFAHLIVGIRQKHNAHWRCAAASLGATAKATGRARNTQLHDKMNEAPFALIAIMQSGEERELKRVYRRSRRYQQYRLGRRGERYHIDGEWIETFRYDRMDSKDPQIQ
ncbi:MAG: SprT-like domain-containing protein [Pseudomonadota bacterium]